MADVAQTTHPDHLLRANAEYTSQSEMDNQKFRNQPEWNPDNGSHVINGHM